MSILNRLARTTALTALGFALVAPVAVYAQETTGTIRGQIASAGAPVTGADVTIIHTPSGSRARATTDSTGQFSASGLRAGGPYTVEVTAETFQPTIVDELFLTVTEPFTLALSLVPADKEVERIIVRATAVGRNRVDGTSTGLRRDKIDGIVTPGRDIRELARQSPLVTQNTVGDGGISIAGSNRNIGEFLTTRWLLQTNIVAVADTRFGLEFIIPVRVQLQRISLILLTREVPL